MKTLEVSLTTDDGLLPAGTVQVPDSGDLSVETQDEGLRDLIENLDVTADLRGAPVKRDDPDYALAVADSIGRQSAWLYTAEPK